MADSPNLPYFWKKEAEKQANRCIEIPILNK